MKDKIFGVLQRVGRSFMLPIALLPVAGLLLGIGSSFTNETMLAAYGLNSVIHPGTLIYTILDVMSQTGNAVFSNLALLFAMGVAIGMARKEKEVAALSGAVAYIIMNTAIQAMINAAGGVEAMPANSTTTMLGITTLQMGVFGGIVVGLGVQQLLRKVQIPLRDGHAYTLEPRGAGTVGRGIARTVVRSVPAVASSAAGAAVPGGPALALDALVGLVDLLHALLRQIRQRVIVVIVRVVFAGKVAVSALDLLVSRRRRDI